MRCPDRPPHNYPLPPFLVSPTYFKGQVTWIAPKPIEYYERYETHSQVSHNYLRKQYV